MAKDRLTNHQECIYWTTRAHEAATRGQVTVATQHLERAERYDTVPAEQRLEILALAERMAAYIKRDNQFALGGA